MSPPLPSVKRRQYDREVYAQLDERDYPQGVDVSEAELVVVNLHRDDFHGSFPP